MLAGYTQLSATAALSTSRINTPSAWSKPQHDAVHRKGRTPQEGRLKPSKFSNHGLNRRIVLSTLAVLPTLVGLRPISARAQGQTDALPSWNDGATKKAITEFVSRVTVQGGSDFVRPAERVAVFDNDGTLWLEQPMYVQLAFALDRVKALASQHPEWKDKQPFKAVLEGDMKALAAAGEHGLVELIMATHAGMTTNEDNLACLRFDRFRVSIGFSGYCQPQV